MPVEDVFTITGRGTVATGRVERGVVKVGDEVEIVGLTGRKAKISMYRSRNVQEDTRSSTSRRQYRSITSWSYKRAEIERGQVLAKPDSIHPHKHFEGQVYVLKKEEGGRHTPFFNGYRPQFYFRTTDVTGVIKLPDRSRNGNAWRSH